MTNPIIVHGIPGSPYVRSVLLALEEKEADYRFRAMPFGGHKEPGYRALHPFARIPVIQHGDFTLYETHAILRYIDRLIPQPALVPTDIRAEARMDQIISITNSYASTQISGAVSFPRIFAPHFGLPVDEAAIAAALPDARNCLDAIGRLVGEQPYLTGASMTLADLMLIPHLSYYAQCGEGVEMLARHPALVAWIERMEQRPSMAKTSFERVGELAEAA
jgi:glutathione S-transferase